MKFLPSLFSSRAGLDGKSLAVAAALAALVFLTFGPTIGHDFVNYDDSLYVKVPAVARGLSLAGVAWAFTHVQASNWHPLTTISHMLDCRLYGQHPWGHHLTNVLLHALAAALLFLSLRELTGAFWRCAFVAAIFAVHPLRAESVAWVSERKDVLSAVFFMLTLWAYAKQVRRPPSGRRALAVPIWLGLGLLSKPMLVTTPLVLMLLDFWPLGRLQRLAQIPGLLKEKTPLFVLSLFSCVATVIAQTEAIHMNESVPFSLRLGNALLAYATYLRKMVFPFDLAALYPAVNQGWPIGPIALALLLLVVLSAMAFAARRHSPAVLVGWLWYLGMLVPVIGLLQVGHQAYADRYTYLPQIGLGLALAWPLADWAIQRHARKVLAGCAALLTVAALIFVARRQAAYWQNSETLWTHTLQVTPNNALAANNLGTYLTRNGRRAEAEQQYLSALKIDPQSADAHNNLGLALIEDGRAVEAESHFRKALQIDPRCADAATHLGLALFLQGRVDEAIAQYRRALKSTPNDPQLQNNLANILLQRGDPGAAIDLYRAALQNDPTYVEAHSNLGLALFRMGRVTEAISAYRAALQIDPEKAAVHENLGLALVRDGRAAEAETEFHEALRIDPANSAVRADLANLLLQIGQPARAAEQFRLALREDPDNAALHTALGHCLLLQGQVAEAVAALERALRLQPASATAENNLAWVLATAPRASLRDGARAVDLASRANRAAGDADPVALRTLAAAYAENTDFPNARRVAHEALQRAIAQPNTALANALRREISFYEAGQPYPLTP